jgi:hypothetical protein
VVTSQEVMTSDYCNPLRHEIIPLSIVHLCMNYKSILPHSYNIVPDLTREALEYSLWFSLARYELTFLFLV